MKLNTEINAKKFNYLLIIIIVSFLFGALAITYYGLSIFKKRSDNLVSAKLDLVSLNYRYDTAIQQRNDLIKNSANIELLNKIVPKNKDQALAVAELIKIAGEKNLSIGSFTFPASELGSVSKTATTAATEKITQTKAVEGISGLLGIELTIGQINRKIPAADTGISYKQLVDFLQSIEKNRRTMQIKNIQIQPIYKLDQVVGYSPTITINLFVKQ